MITMSSDPLNDADRLASDGVPRATRLSQAPLAIAVVLLCIFPRAAAAENSSPTSVLNNPTGPDMTVIYTNTKSEVAYWYYTPLGWANGPFGGSVAEGTSPVAMTDPEHGYVWVYFVNPSSELDLFVYLGKGWSGVEKVGGKVAADSSPALVLNNPAEAYQTVFYINSKHEVAWWYYASGWANGSFGGSVKEGTSPAATVDLENSDVWVYYVNSTGEIERFTYEGKGWEGPFKVGGKVAANSSPAVVLNSASGPTYTVFYVNSKHEIAYLHREKEWTSGTLGGSVAEGTSPEATINSSNGDMYVYYVNSSHELATFSYAGTWTGPTTIGGKVATNSSPTALLDLTKQYLFYLNGSDAMEYFTHREEWAGPTVP